MTLVTLATGHGSVMSEFVSMLEDSSIRSQKGPNKWVKAQLEDKAPEPMQIQELELEWPAEWAGRG